MKITYENTPEDAVAFSKYHSDNSPTVRQARRFYTLAVPASVMILFLCLPHRAEVSKTSRLIKASLYGACSAVAYLALSYSSQRRQTRRLYAEGENRAIFGRREMAIDESGLVEKTEFSETWLSWMAVERVVETDKHLFILVSALSAYIIPKTALTEVDAELFVSTARKYWEEAQPDESLRSQS